MCAKERGRARARSSLIVGRVSECRSPVSVSGWVLMLASVSLSVSARIAPREEEEGGGRKEGESERTDVRMLSEVMPRVLSAPSAENSMRLYWCFER